MATDILARLKAAACTAGCNSSPVCLRALTEDAADEINRLRRGWLRVIQQENSCPATGGGCLAKRCGCIQEREMLANEQD